MRIKGLKLTEKPIEKLPRNVRRAYEIAHLDIPYSLHTLECDFGIAQLGRGKQVIISWGLNLGVDDLKPDKKYVWTGRVFSETILNK